MHNHALGFSPGSRKSIPRQTKAEKVSAEGRARSYYYTISFRAAILRPLVPRLRRLLRLWLPFLSQPADSILTATTASRPKRLISQFNSIQLIDFPFMAGGFGGARCCMEEPLDPLAGSLPAHTDRITEAA